MLAPDTLTYDFTFSGRPFGTLTRVLDTATHDGQSVWQIVTVLHKKAPSLDTLQADTLITDRSSLRPLHSWSGGMGPRRFTFTDTSVTGTISKGKQTKNVNESFDQPVLATEAHLQIALAALPFENGYSARFPVFQDQAVATMTVHVTGTKTVETPAGSFETYVLKATSQGELASGTIYVRTSAPHHMVKADLEQEQSNGKTTTSVITLTDV